MDHRGRHGGRPADRPRPMPQMTTTTVLMSRILRSAGRTPPAISLVNYFQSEPIGTVSSGLNGSALLFPRRSARWSNRQSKSVEKLKASLLADRKPLSELTRRRRLRDLHPDKLGRQLTERGDGGIHKAQQAKEGGVMGFTAKNNKKLRPAKKRRFRISQVTRATDNNPRHENFDSYLCLKSSAHPKSETKGWSANQRRYVLRRRPQRKTRAQQLLVFQGDLDNKKDGEQIADPVSSPGCGHNTRPSGMFVRTAYTHSSTAAWPRM